MARVPEVRRENLPADLREAFDQVLEANGGRVSGPTSITVNSPEMARRRGHLTSYLRYENDIPQNFLELAICTTARAMDCAYVWNAHAPAARRAGVSDAVIDALREKNALPEMDPQEQAIVNYCQEFYTTHKVAPATFQAALDLFGTQTLVELTALMGHYAQTSFILNAFDVQLPEGTTEPVLPV